MKFRLGEDLNPQMQAIDSTVDPVTQDRVDRSVESLLQAAQVVQDELSKTAASDSTSGPGTSSFALSLLADTALTDHLPSQLPQMRTDPTLPLSTSHRNILTSPSQGPPPQGMAHGPTDPRSFLLPRPSPISSQPRLPNRGQLGLPDPFAMTGPPQLPPPPGSNFRSLPRPNYQLPGPPPPLGPAPPGPPGPPGPGSLYFPPHGHGHPSGPPPRRY